MCVDRFREGISRTWLNDRLNLCAGLLASGLSRLCQLREEEMALYGSCVRLCCDGPLSKLVHRCILRCRCRKLFNTMRSQETWHLAGVTCAALEDLVAFLYTSRLPWDWDPGAESDCLQQRVLELCHAAAVAEIAALECCCSAWLVATEIRKPSELKSKALAESWSSSNVAAGSVVGQGLPGAVLEDDVATLLEEGNDPSSFKEDKVTLVLSRRSDDAQAPRVEAHRCILGACSGFFAAAMSSEFVERQGVVHLGFVEEQGLQGFGADLELARSAFRSLLRFLYTGRLDVSAALAADLLALLRGNFLQLDSQHLGAACEACEAAALGAATLQDLAGVVRRAADLCLDDLAGAALERLKDGISQGDQASVREAASKLSHTLLVELVSLMAEKGCSRRSVILAFQATRQDGVQPSNDEGLAGV